MKAKKISALLLAAAMTACAVPAQGAAADEPKVPKYIFLFIGDGMSYPQVQTCLLYTSLQAHDGSAGEGCGRTENRSRTFSKCKGLYLH